MGLLAQVGGSWKGVGVIVSTDDEEEVKVTILRGAHSRIYIVDFSQILVNAAGLSSVRSFQYGLRSPDHFSWMQERSKVCQFHSRPAPYRKLHSNVESASIAVSDGVSDAFAR